MLVPPADISLPSAVDFFDLKRWTHRFSGPCVEWLEMFAQSQSFTQFLEQRLAPRDSPELEVQLAPCTPATLQPCNPATL